MTYVIDIDNHILFSDVIICQTCGRFSYILKKVDHDEIRKINQKYDDGDTIIFQTGRGWDIFNITKEQLAIAGVKYHCLIMGKPVGIYIDKESEKTIE